MTALDRLRLLVSALPTDSSAVTLTRADLEVLLQGAEASHAPMRDLTVEEVAEETGRAPSTVRGWLISGELRGYKLNRRDWRVPCAALREYLQAQRAGPGRDLKSAEDDVDLGAWRKQRGVR